MRLRNEGTLAARPDFRTVVRLPAAALLAASLLASVPLAAQTAPDVVSDALAARNAGDYARAIAMLEAAERDRPADPALLFALGTSYAFSGKYPQAITALTHARQLAPRDNDIALALARAYLWSGDDRAASAIAGEIAASDPANAELPALRQSIAQARHPAAAATLRPLVAVSQTISGVQIGAAHRTWYETIGALAVPVWPRATLAAEIDREDRAGIVDTHLQLRLDHRIGASASAYLALAGTPNANVRERLGIRAGGEVPVARLLSLTADLRYASYNTADVFVAEPGLRLHSADDRYAFAVRSIQLWSSPGDHQSGWAMRAEAQPRGALRLFAGGATYPDTEAGVTRRVRSAFASAAFPLNGHLALRVTYEHENRVSTYTRDSAILGASWRF